MKLNLFALVKDEKPIRRIPVSNELQEELSSFFIKQKSDFYKDEEKSEFTGRYNVDDGEIFKISNYPIPGEIQNSLSNPLEYQTISLKGNDVNIIALYTGEWNLNSKYVCFQVFDSRRIISKGFTLIHSGNTFTKLKDPGLSLQENLTALYDKNELLFYSYHNTRRFLDLTAYYKEATDKDITKFAKEDNLQIDDIPTFQNNADSFIRKKITLLLNNKILKNINVKSVIKIAKKYNLAITQKNNKILIPGDIKEIKKLLRFLDEDYFETELTKRKALTNSKKYL